ncbi:hypothetical protein DYE49_01135 [Treponema rectale]|uniref:Lipoprotein n=1 Tax=Treponema rectale TaxID=744512 RepID=A0A7M1XK14_9SPIR|nr:hypothetical protein DYE49_01135 [Treponema rectale]
MKRKLFKVLCITLPLLFITSCSALFVYHLYHPYPQYEAMTDEMVKIENYIKEAEKEETKIIISNFQSKWISDYFDHDKLLVTKLKEIEFQPIEKEKVNEWSLYKNALVLYFVDQDYRFVLKDTLTSVIVSAYVYPPTARFSVGTFKPYVISKEAGEKLVEIAGNIISNQQQEQS